nr:hypothetical protein [Actinomycetales bacterium]
MPSGARARRRAPSEGAAAGGAVGPAPRRSSTVGGTRLLAPVPTAAIVSRPRVDHLLDLGLTRPVTLVSAGPGFGKTVAVAAWSQRLTRPVVWISLTTDERDSARLVSSLHESAVAALGSAALAGVGHLLTGDDAHLLALLTALGRHEAVVVLDDVHLLEAGPSRGVLSTALRHLPEGVRLVLLSRHDPSIGLHRLRLNSNIAEVRSQELAFTLAEATELCAVREVALPADTIEHLVRVTDGWVVALQLACMALQNSPDPVEAAHAFDGGDSFVSRYVLDQLLDLDERRRHVLISTSAVDEVCGPLAVALSGDPGAELILEELAAEDYFMVSTAGWYRQHTLVRQALRTRHLRRESGTELNRRAAQWFQQQAEHAEALRYAIRSGDWDFAAHISERSSLGVILTPDHRDLGAMLADIPDDEVVSRPNLLVARAWARFDEENYDRAIAKLSHAEWSINAHPERERQETVVSLHLLSALISRVRGDAAGTVAAASRTLEAIRGLDDGLQQDASLLTDIAARLRAIGELWQGQPQRLLAMRDWSGLHAQVSTSLDFFGSAWEGLTALAEVAQGRLENARRRAMRTLSEHKRIGAEEQESPGIGPWSDTGRTAHAWLALGLVAAHQADVDTMDECLTLGRAANTHANPFLTAGFLLLTAHRRLAR